MDRTLSVRAHLAVIIVGLALVLVGLGAFQTANAFSKARRAAGLDSAFQARLAATALSSSIKDARTFTAGTAASPSISQLFETIGDRYDLCSLSAGGTGLFDAGSIHFLDSTGFLFCSSIEPRVDQRGLQYGALAWMTEAMALPAGGSLRMEPFTDPATGKRSIAFAAPVKGGAGHSVGVVVYALPVAGLAEAMAATYGGVSHMAFDVMQSSTGTLVSSSEAPAPAVGVRPVSFRAPPGEAVQGLDGVRRFYRSSAAAGSGLVVTAGVSEALTLANARADLRGHLSLTVVALAVTLILGLLVNRRIGRPLRRLTAAVEQAGRAVTPEPVAVNGPREVRSLVERFNGMLATQADSAEQLRQRVLYDPLTGLPNRVVAIDRLTHALDRTRRWGGWVGVLSIDLDRFGIVNESLGRDVGDRMLILVAGRIRSVLRPEDTVVRFYGDEFIAIVEGIGSADEAADVADRIAATLREPLREGELEATVSCSTGIALGRFDEDTAETLLRDADAARAVAKRRGKARHEFFEASMREHARNRLELENDLRRAVEGDELHVVFQPLIDLGSGRVSGAESLLRWHHPSKGVLLPGVFIGLAEETGLIVPIGRRIMEQACTQGREWADQGHPIRVSVNLSARQVAEPRLDEEVRAVLEDTGLDPERLCFEVTETTLMREEAARAMLERLKAMGASISVDDFGTGYSSLAYLQRFRIDELKVDRAFVKGLDDGSNGSALVAAIVGMARALDLRVVAEGVETEAQLEAVRMLGCDAAQGYLFMRPQPAQALTPLLELDDISLPEAWSTTNG